MSRWMLALSLGFVLTLSDAALADPPSDSKTNADVIARLDAILNRLDAIEQRLAKLEEMNRMLRDWWVDDHGIMRSTSGRPIGFWGIDGSANGMEPRR